MKKYFLLISILFLFSCNKDNGFYKNYITAFTTREMSVNVTPQTTSFLITVTQKGGASFENIYFNSEKSTTIVNEHCYLPKDPFVSFPNNAGSADLKVEIYPEKIKENLTMTFYIKATAGKEPGKYIDTITVKLIPTLK